MDATRILKCSVPSESVTSRCRVPLGEGVAAEAMVGPLLIPSEDKQFNGKFTQYVVHSCMIAATGGFLFGYDIGVSGGVSSMEQFLTKFFPDVYRKMREDSEISNYCEFDSEVLTSFTSSLYIAGLVASFIASSFTSAFGRKSSILVGGASFIAGGALGGVAFNVYMLIFGRILLGVGVGFTNQAIPIYLSEMAPPKNRGAMNNGFQLCISIGVLLANLVNYCTERIRGSWSWRISLSMAVVPAIFLIVGSFFIADTPNSLIQRSNDHHRAKAMLQQIRGVSDVQAELEDLVKANEMSRIVKSPFKNIIQRKYRPQLVMAISIPFFHQATGINIIGFYGPQLFQTMGLGENASLFSAVMTGVVGIVSTFIGMLIVDKYGRRALFIAGGIQMFISQMVIGGIMVTQVHDHGGLSKGYASVLLVMICIFIAAFSWSWGPLLWLISSEIMPLEIRSAGQSIFVAVSFLCTFIFAQTFLALLCHFKSGTFFFFGGWMVLMTAFIFLFLPETGKIPLEQMDKVWKEHWFWKSIVLEAN